MSLLRVKFFKNSTRRAQLPDNQPSPGTRNLREQAMMAWETLDEPGEEQDEVKSIG